jgi:peptidoglycan LD-endopeptidase LytH
LKYVALFLLGLILGALAYHQISVSPTPEAGPASPTPADPVRPPTMPAAAKSVPAPPIATATPVPPVEAPGTTPSSESQPLGASGLLIPVQGKTRADLVDTFTDARSQGRLHDAIDIMAQAGTPVLAVADGQVEKLFTSDRGGLTLYQFEPSGKYAYYYAHLERYAPGLEEKQSIKRGQVIGYVGSTGNANPSAPHLHFAIFVLGPERHWWEGTAINPYPLLSATS